MAPLIEIRDLRVEARGDDGQVVEIVKGVSFAVENGEVMGLIGESGSGKTTIALALLGYARFGCRLSGGSVRVGETEVLRLEEPALRKLRGRRVAYIAQSAAASFNPSRSIMQQVIEARASMALSTKRPRGEGDRIVPLDGDPQARDDRRTLSASGLGRPAPAADGGDGAHHRSGRRDLRRTDHRA